LLKNSALKLIPRTRIFFIRFMICKKDTWQV
jgi:hypothetical protein